MKRLKSTAAIVLALAGSVGAAAAASPTHEATGRVDRVNPRAQHVTIGHQAYRYNPRVMNLALKRGERVHVIYRNAHGHRYAIQILPAA
jgi:Cu/Ag efflux protein CusF